MKVLHLTGRITESGALEVDLTEALPAGEVQVTIELPDTDQPSAAEGGTGATPRRSLWGLCADLGPAPSAQDIDDARQEAWAGFARDV